MLQEWAIFTGKYREGIDEPDYAIWKTRLRCAFNKAPDIQEIKELTDLDAVHPFRVYKFLPKTSRIYQESPLIPPVHNFMASKVAYVGKKSEMDSGGDSGFHNSGSMDIEETSIHGKSLDIMRSKESSELTEKELADLKDDMQCPTRPVTSLKELALGELWILGANDY